MGYDPYEEPGWRIGNTDIMKEIREMSKESAVEMLSIQGDSILILKAGSPIPHGKYDENKR